MELVLKKLSFEVASGHKVGVVGRTGAGKSTVSIALTRIVELVGGKIEIDDVDISKLDLAVLRNKITMIPQDPMIQLGTLRMNIDPFNECTDERIIDLIKKAGLEYLFEGKSKQEIFEEQQRLKAEKAKQVQQQKINKEEKTKQLPAPAQTSKSG